MDGVQAGIERGKEKERLVCLQSCNLFLPIDNHHCYLFSSFLSGDQLIAVAASTQYLVAYLGKGPEQREEEGEGTTELSPSTSPWPMQVMGLAAANKSLQLLRLDEGHGGTASSCTNEDIWAPPGARTHSSKVIIFTYIAQHCLLWNHIPSSTAAVQWLGKEESCYHAVKVALFPYPGPSVDSNTPVWKQ